MAFFDLPASAGDDLNLKECFQFFDQGNKEYLDSQDFYKLTESLFKNDEEFPDESNIENVLSCFGLDMNCRIEEADFEKIWNDVIRPLLKPVTALLVIDMQNDFIDGSLALKNCPAAQDGKDAIPIINNLIEQVKFDFVVYSLDYHPDNHISFLDNVDKYKLSENFPRENLKLYDVVEFLEHGKMEQKLWPVHCIQDTWGAELHPDLKVVDNPLLIHKGTNPDVDSYSAFWDNMKLSSTGLHEELQKRHVTHVFVCGLAFEVCVSHTALHAAEAGYATTVVEDAARGIDDSQIEKMREKLIKSSCVLVSSEKVEDLNSGKDIRLSFASTLNKD